MKNFLIGLLALGSVSAFADSKLNNVIAARMIGAEAVSNLSADAASVAALRLAEQKCRELGKELGGLASYESTNYVGPTREPIDGKHSAYAQITCLIRSM